MIRAITDDIKRFDEPKKYVTYIALVPWVKTSKVTIHHGHITKRGSLEKRTAFVQCVLGMVRRKKITEHSRIMTK